MRPREAGRRITQLGELLGLAECLDVPFSDHSAGMRQRMSLARALLHDPDVSLLDEPTRSFSPETALPLQDLVLRRLVGEEGKTVLLFTQDMRVAQRMCRELVLLGRGDGPVRQAAGRAPAGEARGAGQGSRPGTDLRGQGAG